MHRARTTRKCEAHSSHLSASVMVHRAGTPPGRARRNRALSARSFDLPRRKEDRPEIPPPPLSCVLLRYSREEYLSKPQLHATGLRRWSRSLHAPLSAPRRASRLGGRNPPVSRARRFTFHVLGLINQRNKYFRGGTPPSIFRRSRFFPLSLSLLLFRRDGSDSPRDFSRRFDDARG